MAVKSLIQDGCGNNYHACVTSRGELVVGKQEYSTAYAVTVNAINTAFNFVGPVSGKRFVITDIILYANKGVGAADASVQLYEASSSTSVTEDSTILDIEMLKNSSRDLTGLNLIVSEGKWLNIKTNDDTIFATVMGYYVIA